MAKMNVKLGEGLRSHYENLLLAGNFPIVEFKKVNLGDGYMTRSYNMMEYSTYWLRVCKLAGESLKAMGYPDGAFTSNRKNRNKDFLAACTAAADAITPERVNENLNDRFKGMFD